MTATPASTDRLPDPGAGFVWEEDRGVLVLRPATDRVRAAFTTRLGGVSIPPWDKLNVSWSVGDDDDCVIANRDLAGRTVGGNEKWSLVHQVHGSHVIRARAASNRPDADALWTDDPRRTIAILVADCVPILLVGRRGIAAAHAGWRGTLAGVVQNAAAAIEAEAAFAGPAIGPCCFEVGDDVSRPFLDLFGSGVLRDERHVDLWSAVGHCAREAGVATFHAARTCTACNPGLFFSHRRDKGRTGRQALLARLP